MSDVDTENNEPIYQIRIMAIEADCEFTYGVTGFGAAIDRARALLAQYCDRDPNAVVSIIDSAGTVTPLDCRAWRGHEALVD